jgi:hypothetical protein
VQMEASVPVLKHHTLDEFVSWILLNQKLDLFNSKKLFIEYFI